MPKPKSFIIESRLHVWRAEKRLTQEDLANAVGVTRATILAIEKGNYNPTLELVFKLTRYFGVKVEEIFIAKEAK